jgi:hypothetical protein
LRKSNSQFVFFGGEAVVLMIPDPCFDEIIWSDDFQDFIPAYLDG